jgi:fumarate hydratase class II
MPGKVNPVLAESLIQACAHAIAADAAVTQAALGGYFELNTMLPLAAHHLIGAVEVLGAATKSFSERCVRELSATERGPQLVEQGLAIATGLVPLIGYDEAAAIAKAAAASGKTVREIAKQRTRLTDAELAQALDPLRMTEPTG